MMLVAFAASALSFGGVLVKEMEVFGMVSTNVGFIRCLFAGIGLLVMAMVGPRFGYLSFIPTTEETGGGSGDSTWRRWLLAVSLAGFFYGTDLYFLYWSMEYIPSGFSAVVNHTQVFWVSMYSAYVMGERLSGEFKLCIIGALAGILILAYPSFSDEQVGSEKKSAGELFLGTSLAILSGLACGLYNISFFQVSKIARGLPIVCNRALNVAAVCLMSALTLLAFMWSEGRSPGLSVPRNLFPRPADYVVAQRELYLMAALLSFGVHIVGSLALSTASVGLSPSVVSMMLLLSPALAELWGVLFLQEPLGVLGIVGAILALISIYYGGTHAAPHAVSPSTRD